MQHPRAGRPSTALAALAGFAACRRQGVFRKQRGAGSTPGVMVPAPVLLPCGSRGHSCRRNSEFDGTCPPPGCAPKPMLPIPGSVRMRWYKLPGNTVQRMFSHRSARPCVPFRREAGIRCHWSGRRIARAYRHLRDSGGNMLDSAGPGLQNHRRGAVAQSGERVVRNDEVRGSIPLGSTRFSPGQGGCAFAGPANPRMPAIAGLPCCSPVAVATQICGRLIHSGIQAEPARSCSWMIAWCMPETSTE